MKSINSVCPPTCCEKGPTPSCKWKEFCKEEQWYEYQKVLEGVESKEAIKLDTIKESILITTVELLENYFSNKISLSEAIFIAKINIYNIKKKHNNLIDIFINEIEPVVSLGNENSPIKGYWDNHIHPEVRNVLNTIKQLCLNPLYLEEKSIIEGTKY